MLSPIVLRPAMPTAAPVTTIPTQHFTAAREDGAHRHPHGYERTAVDLEVVVPAYNEARRLAATLGQLVAVLADQPLTARVVVVDNGSSDETAAVARAWDSHAVPVTVVGCAEPGKGAAVLRGLRTSRARWVGLVDADVSTPVATITRAVEELRAGAVAAIALVAAGLRRTDEVAVSGGQVAVLLHGCDEVGALIALHRIGVDDADVRLATRQEILAGLGFALGSAPLLRSVGSR